ncbi:hypothetical protein 10RS306A_gene4599 [Ralstonia phage 10RS306A]|uniref:Uncharacterized protein n=1 Tax=Ralstonia phage 10RS306A TaxID=2968818 RepID=A0A977TEP1_9CAUD|nr:hypothetical protein 10RS306A_gene4599 [Ralstonia phage 10RS306A]
MRASHEGRLGGQDAHAVVAFETRAQEALVVLVDPLDQLPVGDGLPLAHTGACGLVARQDVLAPVPIVREAHDQLRGGPAAVAACQGFERGLEGVDAVLHIRPRCQDAIFPFDHAGGVGRSLESEEVSVDQETEALFAHCCWVLTRDRPSCVTNHLPRFRPIVMQVIRPREAASAMW